MWLWLSLTALLCWSGSDLFSKIGARETRWLIQKMPIHCLAHLL